RLAPEGGIMQRHKLSRVLALAFACLFIQIASVPAQEAQPQSAEAPQPFFLGAGMWQIAEPSLTALGLTGHHVLVAMAYPNSPAQRAGLLVGDIILALNGRDVASESFTADLKKLGAGSTAVLTVLRGTEHLTITATLEAQTEPAQGSPEAE